MKKIPTLFVRQYESNKVIGITEEVTHGCEWVLAGDGMATIKLDGACCAVINGELYKRYDAKRGKSAPEGAIPCCEPDSITGHHPHWVKCDRSNSSDKWFWSAYDSKFTFDRTDGTYEAVGVHFNGNPYGLDCDKLVKHGVSVIGSELVRTFDGIKEWLSKNNEEGIVFWKDGEPHCKIKRADFGLHWGK